MSDIKAVLNSDSTIKAILNTSTSSYKTILQGGQTVKALLNNGVNIYNRVNGGVYIHFDVANNGNNQSFTDSDLNQYELPEQINLFKNGVNIEPTLFTKTNNTTIQINTYLSIGDTIDILATGSASNGGGADTGNVTFDDNVVQGTGDETGGYGLYLAPGVNSTGNLQYLRVRGGDYPTHIHFDTGNNQYFDQYMGDDNKFVKIEANGNVSIKTNDYVGNSGEWNFTTTGNLVLPGNTFSVNYANGTVVPIGGGGNGTPGGSNTQIQFNDDNSFGADANLTYNKSTKVLTVDEITLGKQSANINSQFMYFRGEGVAFYPTDQWFVDSSAGGASKNMGLYNGNVLLNTFGGGTVNGTRTDLGNVSIVKLYGGSNGQVLTTDGVGNLSWTTSTVATGGSNTEIQFNNNGVFGGNSNFTINTTNNSLSVTGTTNIQQATEKVITNGTGSTGTLTYDTSIQSVLMKTSNASGNFILNFTNLVNVLTTSARSLTVTFINKNGSAAYYLTGIQIAGVSKTVNWFSGNAPSSGTSNGYDIYNFNIIQTASNTYTVFGSVGGYK